MKYIATMSPSYRNSPRMDFTFPDPKGGGYFYPAGVFQSPQDVVEHWASGGLTSDDSDESVKVKLTLTCVDTGKTLRWTVDLVP